MSWMAQIVARGRQRHGERIAIVDGPRNVTYTELDRRTTNLAAELMAMGVRRGQRVAVVSHNRLEVLETYFALGKLGGTAVPVHYGLTRDELAVIVDSCEVAAAVGEVELLAGLTDRLGTPVLTYDSSDYRQATAGELRVLRGEIADDELMFILHTSATTGPPKGACVDHHSLRTIATGYLADARPDPDVVFLHCGPLSHGAVVIPLSYMAAGATVVLMRLFSPLDCLASIDRVHATHLFVVPEMLRFLLQAQGSLPRSLASLREIIYAAAPMPRPLLLEARARFGCDFRQIYGITEGGGPIATLSPAEHDYTPGPVRAPAASVGRAIMGVTIGSPGGLPPDGVGELWVRGAGVMRGYWRDPSSTAEAMRDGWVRTGDLGVVDEQGYIHLTGRVKDVIIRGGQKVFPAEVERVLAGHPAVRDACVVGVPSEEWGEVPLAYVVAAEPAVGFVASLRELVRENLAAYKRPVGFEIVSELPRNSIGKVARLELRRRAVDDAAYLTGVLSRSGETS